MSASRGAVIFSVLALAALGTVMIYSASAPTADRLTGNGDNTLVKHLFWLGLGLCAFAAVAVVEYEKWEKMAPWIFGIAATFLAFVMVPHVGAEVNGARRWFRLGDLSFQPSELMKIALPLFLAWYLGKDPERARTFKRGFLPVAGAIAFAVGLTAIEPDLGTAGLLAISGGCVALLGGVRLVHALPGVLAVVPVAALGAFLKFDHVKKRLLVFMNPDADPLGAGYQIKQALIALGSGGKFGAGLGMSRQKLFFLPEKHTDFIFSILGEELGLVGGIAVLALFLFLLWHGRTIARRCRTNFGALAAAGLLMNVGFQAAMNIAVVTASMPTKGISLPFLSFGGSGLFFTLAAMGFIVSVSRDGDLAEFEAVQPSAAVEPALPASPPEPTREAAGSPAITVLQSPEAPQ
ncbi:MAG: putative lipid II flippase FtsW [Planctomycetes bacterium]|nr:putative lipid II flippase FtsW [Planctomycetota bacterium]